MSQGHGHDHPHDHGHTHDENPHAGEGTVLLDIGGEIGALVVIMPASMLGEEVEIRPTGSEWHDHLPHVAVIDRPGLHARQPSLVFPEVVEGTYDLSRKGTSEVVLTAEISGGSVTFESWIA